MTLFYFYVRTSLLLISSFVYLLWFSVSCCTCVAGNISRFRCSNIVIVNCEPASSGLWTVCFGSIFLFSSYGITLRYVLHTRWYSCSWIKQRASIYIRIQWTNCGSKTDRSSSVEALPKKAHICLTTSAMVAVMIHTISGRTLPTNSTSSFMDSLSMSMSVFVCAHVWVFVLRYDDDNKWKSLLTCVELLRIHTAVREFWVVTHCTWHRPISDAQRAVVPSNVLWKLYSIQ